VQWLAEVHLAGFAPAFTLSFHDSEFARKPPMLLASVVSGHSKKEKMTELLTEKIFDELSVFSFFSTFTDEFVATNFARLLAF